jgi:hypothetical protein
MIPSSHEALGTGLLELQHDVQARPQRQVWAERRRAMEAKKVQFGPDGVRSLWHSRMFSVALGMFHSAIQLVGLDKRGRRNALDVQLTDRSFFLPNLPRSFDGYRILHLSDTHLDCLPDLATVTARLLAGVCLLYTF